MFVQVEITNRCNLRCPYCSRQTNPPKLRDMTPEKFDHVLRELLIIKGKLICVCGLGEPLLNPYFFELLENPLLKSFPRVKLITNGTLLNEENVDRIISSGTFKIIQVSLQTTHREVFDKIQVGADFDAVVENTKRLISKSHGAQTTILVQYLKTRLNFHESKRHFEKLLDIKFGGNIRFKLHVVGPVGGMAKNYSYENLIRKRRYLRACRGIFGRDIIINAFGDLLGCCWDNTRSQNYGNIFEESLPELRRGSRLRRLREELKNNDVHRLPLCKRCLEICR